MQNPTILIVEDEPELLDMYQAKFAAAGYSVFTAHNGEIGLIMAKNQKPDLIILDILMPEVDGYQMLEKLKSSKETARIPVVIFSNLSQKKEIEKGFRLGAKDFIVKSEVTPKELLEKIKKYL